MEVEIRNIKREFFVDEEGLYSNIIFDVVVKPEPVPEFIELNFTISPLSSLT